MLRGLYGVLRRVVREIKKAVGEIKRAVEEKSSRHKTMCMGTLSEHCKCGPNRLCDAALSM